MSGVVEWYDNGKGLIKPREGPGIYFSNANVSIKKHDEVEYELKEEAGKQVADKVTLSPTSRSPPTPTHADFLPEDFLQSFVNWEDNQVMNTVYVELNALRKRVEVLTQEVEAKSREAALAVERAQFLERELRQSLLVSQPSLTRDNELNSESECARDPKAQREKQYDEIRETLANWEMIKRTAADVTSSNCNDSNNSSSSDPTPNTNMHTQSNTTIATTSTATSRIPTSTDISSSNSTQASSLSDINSTNSCRRSCSDRNNNSRSSSSSSSDDSSVHSQKRVLHDFPSELVRKRSKILNEGGDEQGMDERTPYFMDEQIEMMNEAAVARQVRSYMCEPESSQSDVILDVYFRTLSRG